MHTWRCWSGIDACSKSNRERERCARKCLDGKRWRGLGCTILKRKTFTHGNPTGLLKVTSGTNSAWNHVTEPVVTPPCIDVTFFCSKKKNEQKSQWAIGTVTRRDFWKSRSWQILTWKPVTRHVVRLPQVNVTISFCFAEMSKSPVGSSGPIRISRKWPPPKKSRRGLTQLHYIHCGQFHLPSFSSCYGTNYWQLVKKKEMGTLTSLFVVVVAAKERFSHEEDFSFYRTCFLAHVIVVYMYGTCRP